MALAIGIDLGGTGIYGALVDRMGRVLAGEERRTPVSDGPEAVIRAMAEMAETLRDRAPGPVLGIGMGVPGLLDHESGTVITSPNLFWRDIPLLGPIRGRVGLPVAMENDVRVGALGELHFGAGRPYANFLFTALGTGVGSGIVLNRQIYTGPYGTAGEFGHIPIRSGGVRCNCGSRGCLETQVSGPAVRRRALSALLRSRLAGESRLRELPPSEISARTVAEAARAGDLLARQIMTQVGTDLGLGILAYYNLMGPEAVIVGGGVALAGDLILEPARRICRERLMPGLRERVRILPAELGDEAGAVGAATLVPGFVLE